MSDDTRQHESRAQRAEQIMSDPLVIEALATVRDSVRDLFFALPSEHKDAREMLHLMDRARQQFEGVFRLLIAGASVDRHELLEEEHTKARLDAIRAATLRR